MIKNLSILYYYRELISVMVVRDLKVKYKGSALGFLWSFLHPAFMLGLYYVIFTLLAPDFRKDIPNYGLFLIAGMWPWMAFSSTVGKSAPLFILNADLIKKAYFPREILPIATTLSEYINLIIGVVLVFILMVILKFQPNISIFLIIPLLIAQLFLTFAISFMVSLLDVFYRDTEQILNWILTVLFFASPVIYSLTKISSSLENHQIAYRFYFLNPFAWLIPAYRFSFLGTPETGNLLIASLLLIPITLVIFIICYMVFKRFEYSMVEEV
ncbi:ABC transporter permease [bacterium]|nr:ABC transporter permease [bacterium]MBU1024899.1 ABC transporter permease [bacterium]